jgi:hypothetical protein
VASGWLVTSPSSHDHVVWCTSSIKTVGRQGKCGVTNRATKKRGRMVFFLSVQLEVSNKSYVKTMYLLQVPSVLYCSVYNAVWQ